MKLKVYLIISISLFIILCTSDRTNGCADFGDESVAYNLLSPFSIDKPDLSPFYFTFHAFFETNFDNDSVKMCDNLMDWAITSGLIDYNLQKESSYIKTLKIDNNKNEQKEYIDRYIIQNSISEIKALVYTAGLDEVKEIQKYISGQFTKIDTTSLRFHSFVNMLKERKLTEVIDYIIYAKECDLALNGTPDKNQNYTSWIKMIPDSVEQENLFKVGKKTISRIKTDYIKLRYAYQLVRFAHYLDKLEECSDLFDKYISDKNEGKLIYYWALGHKAWAVRVSGNNALSNYLYSKIFANCPSKNVSAFQSFNISTGEGWDSCMSFCKSPAEQATLYAIRGINFKNDASVEMNKILELDPNSKFLELLLARETTKLENSLLEIEYRRYYVNDDTNKTKERENALRNLDKLHKVVKNCLINSKVIKKSLWSLADGYFDFLKGDLKSAYDKFIQTEKMPDCDSLIKIQIKIFKIADDVSKAKSISETFENSVYKELNNLLSFSVLNDSRNALFDYVFDKFSYLYFKQNDFGKAFLCKFQISELYANPKLSTVDSILSLINKPNKSDFEKFLLRKSEIDNMNYIAGRILEKFDFYVRKDNASLLKLANDLSNSADPLNQLQEIKGTIYLSQYKFKEALQTFNQISESFIEKSEYMNLAADPFYGYIEPYYDYDYSKYSKDSYTKITFTKKMLELQKLAETNGPDRAKFYFQLANGYYNITYFGPCWKAIDFYHSYFFVRPKFLENNLNTDYHDYLDPYDTSYVDCNLALDCYKKAINYSNDPEFKARCLFMAAKCEQNEFYVWLAKKTEYYNPTENDNYLSEKIKYRTYFKELKEKYSKTKFYQEAIDKCAYFATFVQKNN